MKDIEHILAHHDPEHACNVRPLKADEGLLFKKLRLGALQDSPDAFSPLFEDFSDRDDAYWHNSVKRSVKTEGYELFIAEIGNIDTPCGLVSGHADEYSEGHIGAMWVSPAVRGEGVGKALLNHVIEYLLQQGCRKIKLTVTETNLVAINLYTRQGFIMTGNSEPLRQGSALENLEMVRKA